MLIIVADSGRVEPLLYSHRSTKTMIYIIGESAR